MHLVARRQADVQAVQEGAQAFELLVARRRVDAVHAGLVQPLQLLGGADVRQHHELLDQPVAVEARTRRRRTSTCPSASSTTCARRGRGRACRAPRAPPAAREARRRAWRAARPQDCPGTSGRPSESPASAAPAPARRSGARRERIRPRPKRWRRFRPSAPTWHLGEQAAAVLVGAQAAPAVATAPRAASARRGRGNRRCCRASRRRGRARSRGARNAATSAMATIRRKPSPSRSAYTASSKSRASSPSMVTSGTSRRSVRPPSGRARARFGLRRAASARRSGRDLVACGSTIRLTERASPTWPSRSTTRAGFRPRPHRRQRLGEHDLAGLGAALLAGRNDPFGLGAAVGRHDAAGCGRAAPAGRKTPSTRPRRRRCARWCGLRNGPGRSGAAGRARAGRGRARTGRAVPGAIRICGGGPLRGRPAS